MKPFRTVDPTELPSHFDAASAEARWDKIWDARGQHRWAPARGREETFVVDTPPSTVSGSLHMGARLQLHAHRRDRAPAPDARAQHY